MCDLRGLMQVIISRKTNVVIYPSDETSPDGSNISFSEAELSKSNGEMDNNGAIYQCSNQASKILAVCHKRRKIKKGLRRFKPVTIQIHKNDTYVNTLKNFGNVVRTIF